MAILDFNKNCGRPIVENSYTIRTNRYIYLTFLGLLLESFTHFFGVFLDPLNVRLEVFIFEFYLND